MGRSSSVSVIYDDRFMLHEVGTFHPEKPERLTAITEALNNVDWRDRLQWLQPSELERRNPLDWIRQVHDEEYIQQLAHLAAGGGGRIDGDTPVSAHSYKVALLAVNAWLDGVDRVIEQGEPTFVLARPPGHHATQYTGMGFCLFSNAAIAATYALSLDSIRRVAILDWDVHHGNGTENIVQHNPHIIYCSLHQYPCYPGTGKASFTGVFNTILNVPIAPGAALEPYSKAFEKQVVPFIKTFKPDLLIVSAGYDANEDDPLAGMNLKPEDYGLFTVYCHQLCDRVLFGLEGGYDFPSLAQSVVETLKACLT